MNDISNGSLKYIAACYKRLARLSPQPTGVAPRLNGIEGIRCVLFDVYGTLLVSNSGDISAQRFRGELMLESLSACGIELADGVDQTFAATKAAMKYRALVEQAHVERKIDGTIQPEIDIRKHWQKLLVELRDENILEVLTDVDYSRLAIEFELRQNPVSPMPNLESTLDELAKHKFKLGVISNAQFFTPVTLNYFLHGITALTLPHVSPFEANLCFYSYQLGLAKPDPNFLKPVVSRLKDLSILPEEVLIVGNDMRNDVALAKLYGFRTALFAGDLRSLRLREDDENVRRLNPDSIVTSLPEVLRLLL